MARFFLALMLATALAFSLLMFEIVDGTTPQWLIGVMVFVVVLTIIGRLWSIVRPKRLANKLGWWVFGVFTIMAVAGWSVGKADVKDGFAALAMAHFGVLVASLLVGRRVASPA